VKDLADDDPDKDIEAWLELMDGELEVNLVVAIKKATKEYEAGNKINGIKPFDESALKGGGLEGEGSMVSSGFAP